MKPRPIVPAKPQQTETNKNGNSVSWHEWTQQLQAYIAWVNSQLRKRPELKSVQDLRTDLQSGEVLAQLIEIICKYHLIIFYSCLQEKYCLKKGALINEFSLKVINCYMNNSQGILVLRNFLKYCQFDYV